MAPKSTDAQINEHTIEKNIKEIFKFIGEDPEREGLLGTPDRMIRSWNKLFGGYKKDGKKVLSTTFVEGTCDEMVILKDIQFYSTCEHHFLPFYGKVSIAYIPNGKVVGISKLARLVEAFSRRLQIQERMTTQIADTINNVLEAKGVMVVVEGQHFCMTSRGVEKQESKMVTNAIRGAFEDSEVRQEFLMTIKN